MTITQSLLLLALASYLIGSIPFGLIVGLARGVDPRNAGSGNIGATNVGRLLGGRYFVLVFVLDMIKSLAPMLVAGIILRRHLHLAGSYRTLDFVLWLLVGIAAILGHMFSIYLRFQGGKGVATSAGVMLGLYPYYTIAGVFSIGVWALVFGLSRYVSLASIVGAMTFPLAYSIFGVIFGWPIVGKQLPLLLCAILVCTMILYRHRSNIGRLRAGTEHGFGR